MRYTHYGVIVDSEVPVIGVVLATIPEWLQEETLLSLTIDLAWDEHLETCPLDDHCDCDVQSDCYLIGFERGNDGKYDINTNAEYSAIVGETYCFVHASKWVQRCALCSPCFPGQGDLDSKGEFLAFTLPPEVWGDTEPERGEVIMPIEEVMTCQNAPSAT